MTSVRRTRSVGIGVVVLAAFLSCKSFGADSRLSVVASTTLLRSAISEVGGRHVSVALLIAPGSCPGHYDISPQDIRKLSASQLVFTHGYEGFVDNILKSMGKNGPKLVKIPTAGNWMVPDVYVRGAKQVAEALCRSDPKRSADYRRSLSLLERRAARLSAELLEGLMARKPSEIAVLCSDQQEPFVKWMGFKVVGTYARPEEFTPAELHKLTRRARTNRVRLVIDNLQSGPTAGRELAGDIGAAHVTLSNFPGGFSGTDTWSECIRDNVKRVIAGTEKR